MNKPADRITKTIETKLDAKGTPAKTELTLIFDNADAERAFAIAHAVVRAQARIRASGAVPAKLEVTMSDLATKRASFGPRTVTPEAAVGAIRALPDDAYRAQLLALAVDAKTADRMVKARAKP